MTNVLLIRFGEVFLKKGNRPWFIRLLGDNLKRGVRTTPGLEEVRVSYFHGRFEAAAPKHRAWNEDELAKLTAVVGRTFGITSMSPASRLPLDLEQIRPAALAAVETALAAGPVRHFKIEASRAFKGFPLNSPEINRKLGADVVERFQLPARMEGADLVVGVEIYEHAAYVFAHRLPGPGGLPVGCSGRAVLLLSGGIDSPVAGWMMAKRGCHILPVHFHSVPYTSRKSIEKVRDLAERLAAFTGPQPVTNIRLTDIQEFLRQRAPADKLVLFYRRSMVRLAARVAAAVGAKALVTGESLAQVASQTLDNLAVIQDASPLPVLRPLIGMDKIEAVDLARRIGTYEISIRPHEDCCSLFLPPHPDTRGRIDEIRALEAGLPELPGLEDAAFNAREIVT